MKGLIDFLKTTAIGGLLVVLPLIVFYLLLSEALAMVVALATPIADLLPPELFGKIRAPVFVALLLILGASFAFGLALRSRTLIRIGHWIESRLLEKLPLYGPVKRLSRGMAGAKQEKAFGVALLDAGDGSRELVYVIEDSGQGLATILIPLAPTGFNGPLKLVDSGRLELIDTSLGEASQVFAHWGVGMQKLAGTADRQKDLRSDNPDGPPGNGNVTDP